MKSAYVILIFGAAALFAICAAKDATDEPTEKPTPSPWFECPGDGKFGNPYNCHKFFVCFQGNAWAFDCPGSLYFNEKSGDCDTKDHANCHYTNTPGPPTSFTTSFTTTD